MTKLRKIPLKIVKIKVRKQDALAPFVLKLLDDWKFKGELKDDQLIEQLNNITDQYAGGVKYMELPFDYKEHILDALASSPKDERTGQTRGFGPREQRKRNKIVAIIEGSDKEVLLESSDYSEVKKAVDDILMVFISPGIEEFYDTIDNAEEVEVKEDKNKGDSNG